MAEYSISSVAERYSNAYKRKGGQCCHCWALQLRGRSRTGLGERAGEGERARWKEAVGGRVRAQGTARRWIDSLPAHGSQS
jgi:hypothetical protein